LYDIQMKIDNLNDLQVLIQTEKEGSLTAAAKVLKLTPAAASAMLKRLESQLGTQLFVRSTRAMRLTSEGQMLLQYAQQAFDLIDEGESLISKNQNELSGPLRITAPVDLTRAVLLPWITEFLNEHPKVELFLTGSDIRLDIVRNDVDVALRYGKLADSNLLQRHLATPHLMLCASRAYLKSRPKISRPEDLKKHNCLTFNRGGQRHQNWRFAKQGKWQEVTVHGDRSVDEATLAREWAVAGAGLTFLSSLNFREDLRKGRLVQVLPEWETDAHPLHAVMPGSKTVPNRTRVFIDFLARKFAELKI
jgi:DNA-binding transcriptional LysR family regulator